MGAAEGDVVDMGGFGSEAYGQRQTRERRERERDGCLKQ